MEVDKSAKVNRYCANCKHAFATSYLNMGYSFPTGNYVCKKVSGDIVTGDYLDARKVRAEGAECGPSGKLWEQYVPPPPRSAFYRVLCLIARNGA